jgi:hypothetical protein
MAVEQQMIHPFRSGKRGPAFSNASMMS